MKQAASRRQLPKGLIAVKLVPWFLLVILSSAVVFVWQQQVRYQRSLQHAHSKDVAFQSSRRLEIFMESRLVIVELFAERWSSQESNDYSKERFAELAKKLRLKIPGARAVWLVGPDRTRTLVAPLASHAALEQSSHQRQIFNEAVRAKKTLLTDPIDATNAGTRFITVTPLFRRGESVGFFAVEFDTHALFGFCFHETIRSEFSFEIKDGKRQLYRYAPADSAASETEPPTITSRKFQVRNRAWRISVSPRHLSAASHTSSKNLLTLLFGLLLSVLVSGLFALFTRHAKASRRAKRQANEALLDKAEAQSALQGTEARYRNVFGSASDGLVVLSEAGLIVDANNAAGRMHGHPPESLIGTPAEELIEPSQRSKFEEFLRRTREGSSTFIELSGVAKGDVHIDVEMRGNTLAGADAPRMLLVMRDVTERRHAQRRLALLSRKVLLAQEEERARVARDLHDELGQIITALRLEINVSLRQFSSGEVSDVEAFRGPVDLIEQATAELRRICEGLRPPLLDDLGLGPAVEQLVKDFEKRTSIGVSTELEVDADVSVSNEIALSVYRILQEATTNIARHSGATSAAVTLNIDPRRILLSVYDNGMGFDPRSRASSRGSGIVGMEERAHLVDGQLRVHSVPGEGTRVVLELPLRASDERSNE